MKKKKIWKVCIVLMAGVLSLFGFEKYAHQVKDEHHIVTQISSKIFDFNTLELNVDSSLQLSDFNVVNRNSGKTIFANGKRRKGILNDYGHRLFELYDKGQKLYEFGHFATNNWYTFDYTLNLKKINNRIELDVQIDGKYASYRDFFCKRFEYDDNGKLDRVSYLSFEKEVYHIEEIGIPPL